MRNRLKAAVALACFGLAWPLAAQTITEFPIPTVGSSYSITAGPDGAMWFTEQSANQIGRITTDGVVTEFPLPNANSGPYGIVTGADDNLWFIEQVQDITTLPEKIGRITPTGVVTEFPIPTANSYAGGIAAGPDGNLWFTEGIGNNIGRITTAGVINEFPIPTPSNARGIAAGPDGNLWFTEMGPRKIGRITTAGVVTEFPMPTGDGGPNGIAAGPDGNLWFTEAGSKIGRITTGGVITEFPMPTATAFPDFGIAAGPDGNMWFTEGDKIGRITMAGVITEFPTPTASSGTNGIAAGPDGNLWFTEVYASQIGRITTSPCSADPTTLCLNGGRFAVTADWEVQSQESNGHGTAVPLTPDSGYFWFFVDSNVEVVAKVLDGCRGADGHYWVFAGGLTNVGVTLTVTDKQADQTRTYTNPPGTPFQPIQDTSAFGTCP